MTYTLSGTELEKLLNSDEYLFSEIGGVLPEDMLPKNISGKCYIVNSDPSYLPGEHWIAIYFPSQSVPEFFDSLGKTPSYYSNSIVSFLKRKKINIRG